MPTGIDSSGNNSQPNSVLKAGQPPDAPGGRATISPPSKQSWGADTGVQMLSSNVDTLNLSINVVWKNEDFFACLSNLKQNAEAEGKDQPGLFKIPSSEKEFLFNIKGHGAKGYEWILDNNEYLLNIGNWQEPKSMPSVMVYIRSETLWRQGPKQAVKDIIEFLASQNGYIKTVKLSRIDLCVDTLFPVNLWNRDLFDYRVTRATYASIHFNLNALTGITFGKGAISARLYDKHLEIQQQSKKTWMFDVWGHQQPPEGKKIIRIEFQLRRETIKELGLDQYNDLFRLQKNLWKYCTQEWLKFQNNPGLKSQQRKTFPWWEEIQNGFEGSQDAMPLIRCKAISKDQDQLFCQTNGLLTSMAALIQERDFLEFGSVVTLSDQMKHFIEYAKGKRISEADITKSVQDKRARYRRSEEKIRAARAKRKEIGLLK